jgi:hypothetical protein
VSIDLVDRIEVCDRTSDNDINNIIQIIMFKHKHSNSKSIAFNEMWTFKGKYMFMYILYTLFILCSFEFIVPVTCEYQALATITTSTGITRQIGFIHSAFTPPVWNQNVGTVTYTLYQPVATDSDGSKLGCALLTPPIAVNIANPPFAIILSRGQCDFGNFTTKTNVDD